MTAALQEVVSNGGNGDTYDQGGVGEAGDDGDNYGRVGVQEAEMYANNPTAGPNPAPNGESYGETYRMGEVYARPQRMVGGIAIQGVSLRREMPMRLMPPRRSPFDRGVGGIAIGPVGFN
jgi:hypothetical protein